MYRSPPDGYTLLVANSAITSNPWLYKLPYDTAKLVPVAMLSTAPQLLAAHPSAPFKTFKEMIAYAKANPETVTVATAGAGQLSHLGTEIMEKSAGIRVTKVHYKGSGNALADLLGGQIHAGRAGFRRNASRPARAPSRPTSYIEGPAFDREGNLYIVDIAFGDVYRISPRGEVARIAESDGEPNGLKIHRDGRIFVTDHKHGLLVLDPATGSLTPEVARYRTERFKGLNDLFFSSRGDLYFTDQGQTGLQDPSGRVYCLRAGGAMECMLSTVPSPNGIALNPAENLLYVAATRGNAIWRGLVLPDGGVTRVGLFIQMSGGAGPDGIAIDQQGNLLVAHAGMGAVWMFSPRGEPLLRIDSCQGPMTTNVAFGGKDNRDLYITESESGCVLVVRLDIPGQILYSHQPASRV